MTLKLHISEHNDDLHSTTAKKNIANGVAGLDSGNYIIHNQIKYNFLTLAEFQKNAATGTCDTPAYINDNDIIFASKFNVIGQYAEILFDELRFISQFYFSGGLAGVNEDGRFKIQIKHDIYNWTDNTLNIIGYDAGSGLLYLDHPCITKGIRIIATTIDTQFNENYIRELYITG